MITAYGSVALLNSTYNWFFAVLHVKAGKAMHLPYFTFKHEQTSSVFVLYLAKYLDKEGMGSGEVGGE